MGQLAAPAPPPAGIAAFSSVYAIQPARALSLLAGYQYRPYPIRNNRWWRIEPAPIEDDAAPLLAGALPVPPAQPAERWRLPVAVGAIPASIPSRRSMGSFAVTGTYVPIVSGRAESLHAEPAAVGVRPVLDSRPAAYRRANAHLRFGLHAVEDIAPRPPARVVVMPGSATQPASGLLPPPVAGFLPGLPAIAAESMPSVAPSVPATIPSGPAPFRAAVPSLPAAPIPARADAVSGPSAIPAESMPGIAAVAPAAIPFASAHVSIDLPTLSTAVEIPALADAVSSAAAIPAESMPAVAAFAPATIPFASARVSIDLPTLSNAVAIPAPADAVSGPSAIPVESMPAVAAVAPATIPFASAHVSIDLPTLSTAVTIPALADAVPGPSAIPVESMPAVAAVAPATIPFAFAHVSIQFPTLSTAVTIPALADAVSSPSAIPVESMPAVAAVAPATIPQAASILCIDARAFSLPACAPPPRGALHGFPAIPVESMPAVAAFQPAALALLTSARLPDTRALSPEVIPLANAVATPAPVPVESLPSTGPSVPAALDPHPALLLPALRIRIAGDSADSLTSPLDAPGPAPVESIPAIAAFQAVPRPAALGVVARAFDPRFAARFSVAAAVPPAPAAAAPSSGLPAPASLDPIARIAAPPAGAHPQRPTPAIPRPGPVSLEYYCHRITSGPSVRIEPLPVAPSVRHRPFDLPAALGRFQDAVRKTQRQARPLTQIFAGPPRPRGRRAGMSVLGRIAATVMVGLALWSGSRIAGVFRQTEELRAQVAGSERALAVGESRISDPIQGDSGRSPMARIRRAIAGRAATEITDTFHSGMAAWGAASSSWAAGWKRHPQGYVSTGEMALFRPSLQYTDYRMEFYGQIEDKSLGWVVRAQDRKNYYAMKFTVIEAGLRPIIAMVHYNVANGKQGHKVQTPLSVMIHNNQPYHVAVEVRGNRFTASIEGEPVESWTDDTLARGGVGFFSEAGEKARLYWMKLSRNQDWVGRFCAYISGDGRAQQAAEVWPPQPSAPRPQPVHPRAAELAFAERAAGVDSKAGSQKTGKHRSTELWNS